MNKPKMTSLERIHAAAKGLPVDRAPVFIWLNAHTGAKLMADSIPSKNRSWNFIAKFLWNRFRAKEFYAKELWRLSPLIFDIHMFNWANLYSVELGSDMFMAAHGTPWRYAKFSLKNGSIRIRDIFGVTRCMGGIYPDMMEPPIKTVKDLVHYQFPDVDNPKLFEPFRKFRGQFPDVSIAPEIWGPQDFTATSMMGMERFMVFLYDYPEEMKSFLKKWTDGQIAIIRKSVEAGADLVAIYDDYGYDNSPIMSPVMWKEFIFPELHRLVDAAHEAGALVMLHSCGYQMPFLDSYVEAGIDILQSFQPMAGNNFEKAYTQYGDRLCFMTGIDIQRGEFLTREEYKMEIIQNYRIGRSKNRFVLGTTHEIQYTMPDANLATIFETIKEIQDGRYD